MWDHRVCQLLLAGQLQPGLPNSTIHHLAGSASHCFAMSPLCPAALSIPPIGLDECVFFISLVVGLPYSSIFCKFWLFFVFKLLLSSCWLCEEAQCVYLRLHLGRKSSPLIILIFAFKCLIHLEVICAKCMSYVYNLCFTQIAMLLPPFMSFIEQYIFPFI